MASKFKTDSFVRMTSLGTATALDTVPDDAEAVLLTADSNAVRFTDDAGSTTPTATVGHLLAVDEPYLYEGDPGDLRVIESAASAELNISYLRRTDL